MNSESRSSRSSTQSRNNPSVMISSEMLITVFTPPLLLGLLGGKVLAEFFHSVGQASEEVFRGDRLPVLKFPPHEPE